jgi:hypothetical protein
VLTIIIFTNGRYTYLSPLLKDILAAKANIKLWIIDYAAKNKKQTIESLSNHDCNLKLYLNKNKIKIIINKKYYTFAERFLKYLKKVKTKYVWFIGDDDRIDTKYLENLVTYLKLETNSGFTLEHLSFSRNEDIAKKINILTKINSADFNLKKDVSKIGLISTQIINVNKYKKISKLLNREILLNYGCPQIYIIFQLIKIFNDWKYIPNIIVFYRYGNNNMRKKYLIERLIFELNGCLQPAKKIFGFNSNMYKNIFKKVFFQNFIPWIIYSLENLGKNKTFKIINQNRVIIPNIKYINLILFLIFITPVRFFSILKLMKKKFNLL